MQFSNKVSLYLVSDAYGILNDETLQTVFQDQQIIVLNYDDPMVFRNGYEKTYKHLVKEKKISVIVRVKDNQFIRVPYDILKRAVKLSLTIDSIFPNIHGEVMKKIPKDFYSAIDSVHSHCLFASVNDTLDYLLFELFSINIRSSNDVKSIVKGALSYFEKYELPLPNIFIQRLYSIAANDNLLNIKLINEFFTSEENLLNFLNEQWIITIKRNERLYYKLSVAENQLYYGESLFDDYDIQKSLPYLFSSGKMQIIEVENLKPFEKWMLPGIKEDDQIKVIKIKSQLKKLEQDFSRFQMKEWLSFSLELANIQNEPQLTSFYKEEWKELLDKLNEHFENWMLEKYQQLHSLPPVPSPKMVHQIPHYLSRFSDKKIALLVLDGMNMAQWMLIKEFLYEQSLKVDEKSTFSWVPSSTSVSRQSIFSGLRPYEFSNSIHTTNREKQQWIAFWGKQGIPEKYIAYEKSLGLKQYNKMDLACFKKPSIKVYGAVIDVIDQFMHGATQGNETVNSELETWLQTSYLFNLISDLLDSQFEVYITSDHGNKECRGIGRLNEGVTVETKGERTRTYTSINLRNNTAQKYSETIPWTDVGLPKNYHVLLAKDDGAFVPKDSRIVTHGGISIEEVIVPFVKVSR